MRYCINLPTIIAHFLFSSHEPKAETCVKARLVQIEARSDHDSLGISGDHKGGGGGGYLGIKKIKNLFNNIGIEKTSHKY